MLQITMKRKISILIVDDNLSFIARIIGLLDEVDNISSIHTAGNYDEASKVLNEKKPDVALLDIQLPGKSGISILKHIKDSSENCQVIMLTNTTGDYYRQQCKKLGAQHFLDKTNDFELVPGIVKDLKNQVIH
jgi:DNA-binding NarL/FixJ family response regulator